MWDFHKQLQLKKDVTAAVVSTGLERKSSSSETETRPRPTTTLPLLVKLHEAQGVSLRHDLVTAL